jgi:hypothetical protein
MVIRNENSHHHSPSSTKGNTGSGSKTLAQKGDEDAQVPAENGICFIEFKKWDL